MNKQQEEELKQQHKQDTIMKKQQEEELKQQHKQDTIMKKQQEEELKQQHKQDTNMNKQQEFYDQLIGYNVGDMIELTKPTDISDNQWGILLTEYIERKRKMINGERKTIYIIKKLPDLL